MADEQPAPQPTEAPAPDVTDILAASIRADREAQPADPGDTPAETQEPTPAQKRAIRILASEVELPDGLDEDTYQKLEKITGEINRGVDSKFKEAAAVRQQVEAERQQLAAMAEQSRAFLLQNREIAALAHEIGQYDNVDWDDALARSPDEDTRNRVRDLRYSVDAKRAKLGNLVGAVQQRQQQEFAQRQSQEVHLLEQLQTFGEQQLKTRIKDWGPEAKARVVEAMKEYGVGSTYPDLDRAAMAVANYHPAIVAAFHDAALYRAALKKAEKDSRQESPTPKPVSRVGGNAVAAAKDPDKMSTEEWLRWRTAQIKSRAA
jgi:hypothetical protein